MLNSIQAAEHEYVQAFGANSWCETIRSSFIANSEQDAEPCEEDPEPEEEVAQDSEVDSGSSTQGSASCSELAMNEEDRKSTRLNSSHQIISYAVFCLKKKK